MGIGEACSIGSALAWAGGVIIYKRLGETLAPLQLNLLKNLIVLALVVPTLLLAPLFVESPAWPALSLRSLVLALLSGMIGIGLGDTLYFRALNLLGAARVGIIGNLYSPFVIALSFALLGERLNAVQGIGFVLVTAGVLLVSGQGAGRPLAAHDRRRGIAFGIAAIALMAVAIVMVKRVLEVEPLLWIVALRLIGGLIALGAVFLRRRTPLLPAVTQPRVRWRALIAAALLGQYVSMMLWLAGYKYAPASVAAILNESASIFIVLLAWAFLREGMSLRKLAGVSCTLSGVACMLLA